MRTESYRHGEGFVLTMNARELAQSLNQSEDKVKQVMRRGFGEAMSRTKSLTKDYLNRGFGNKATMKIATSLAHEIQEDNDDIYAIFGSRGPDYSGEIGFGLMSSPDDDGNRWNIAQQYDGGTDAGWFTWKGDSGKGTAGEYGRQAGKAGGPSPWIESVNGKSYHYGVVALNFIDYAHNHFENSVERVVQRHFDRAFGGVI